MNEIKRVRRIKLLIYGLATLIVLIAMPSFIFFHMYHINIMTIICLAMVGVGIYGVPFCWIDFCHTQCLYRIVYLVEVEKIIDIEQLVVKSKISKDKVLNQLRIGINKGDIKEYHLEDEKLVKNKEC